MTDKTDTRVVGLFGVLPLQFTKTPSGAIVLAEPVGIGRASVVTVGCAGAALRSYIAQHEPADALPVLGLTLPNRGGYEGETIEGDPYAFDTAPAPRDDTALLGLIVAAVPEDPYFY